MPTIQCSKPGGHSSSAVAVIAPLFITHRSNHPNRINSLTARMTLITKTEVAQKAWDALAEVRKEPLALSIINTMDLAAYEAMTPTPEETGAFLAQLTEIAWKTGFMDALETIEHGIVTIVPATNN